MILTYLYKNDQLDQLVDRLGPRIKLKRVLDDIFMRKKH